MKTEKIKSEQQRSTKEVEGQKLDQPGGENVYEEGVDVLEKTLKFLALNLGSVEVGLDENGLEYFKFEFRDKGGDRSKDFKFYTIFQGQVDMLKEVLKHRE